ncbi:LuxR family transcriptional regulator [uncultured Serinicoccus sp.]|uniref:LuxR family transcriptional regulator n=1 Tax=uncultured Serinicoccus sp. TaxID=735514 RepID=UPI002638A1E0|nr:LuxR family transcriptional regulator [uncultured Serinicoccus sp.]
MNEHPAIDDPGQSRAQGTSGVVDLRAEGEELLDQARSTGRGRAVRAVVRQPGQSLVLLGLPAGGGLCEHEAPGPASLLCLSGRVVLSSDGTSHALSAGTACVIPPERHEVTAAVDSVCLLALSLPGS